MDAAILFWIQNHLQCVPLDYFFRFMTFLGDKGLLWIVLSAFLLYKKETRPAGLAILVALALSAGTVQFLFKPLFNRTRPFIAFNVPILITPPFGTSFPSGHAATAFACAWTYFCLFKDKLRWGVLTLAFFIAFSRLYLFVHYPSDVLVGMAVGILLAYVAMWGIGWWEERG